MSDSKRRVLLVGWDAADWKVIDPLIAQGQMPNLKRLMDGGAWGNLATLHPVLSPMLWTTVATGKRPYKHGIYGFTEPRPDGQGARPAASTSRKGKALWNILTQQGLRTHTTGWYCSHPAEPINGVCVSDLYGPVTAEAQAEWTLPEGTVHPAELAGELAAMRLHPSELTAEQILPFIPEAARIDQQRDRRLTAFAKLLCEMVNLHAAATWVMEHRPWDLMAVYNPAIDHFSHGFMRYHPPRMEGVSEQDFELYKDVVNGCYRFHDLMLGRMLELAGPDATVVICSDHGFHSDHLRPARTPKEPAGPAVWHRQHGVLCMHGPGVRAGQRIHGASLLDIAPTVLALYGLPAGADMDGKPLIAALEDPAVPPRIQSWDEIPGEAGMHAPERCEDPFDAAEAMRQLVALGYVEKPDPKAERAATQAARECRFNQARAYLDGGCLAEAEALLQALWQEHPGELRIGHELVVTRLAQRRVAEAKATLDEVLQRGAARARERAQRIDQRREALRELAVQRAEEAAAGTHPRGTTDPAAVRERFARADGYLARAASRLRGLDPWSLPGVRLQRATIALAERRPEAALDHLRHAEKASPRMPGLHLQIGKTYLWMRRWQDAVAAFDRALDVDPHSAAARAGRAAALLRLDRAEEAANDALSAIELIHHMPEAHYCLGVALVRLGMLDRGVEALQTALRIHPGDKLARRSLMQVYQYRMRRPDLAAVQLAHLMTQRDRLRGRPAAAAAA